MRKLFLHASLRWNRELIFPVKDAGILPFKVLFLFFPYLTQIHHTVHNYSFPIIMSEVTPYPKSPQLTVVVDGQFSNYWNIFFSLSY